MGGGQIGPSPALVSVICCVLRGVPMNSKLLEFFTYDLNLPVKNIFFPISFNSFEKTDRKWQKPKKNSIKKQKNIFFFHFLQKNTSNIISKLSNNFSKDFFWGITHFCRLKNKDFRKLLEFLWLFQQNHMVDSKIVKFWARQKLNISKRSSE